jgi:toxin-antitoxin system PIN domain toxin
VIAVDTNILIYAHRPDAPFNEAAHHCLVMLAEGRATWAIPWPCIHEFLAVVTNPKAFRPPSALDDALDQMSAWLASPSVSVLAETPRSWSALSSMLRAGRVVGPRIHDARIAALCQVHGVRELWTADRDFSRFPGIAVFNPLVADSVHETAPAYGAHRRARTAVRRRTVRRRALAGHPE